MVRREKSVQTLILNSGLTSLHFTNDTLPPFSRATKIPTTSVAAASRHWKHRRREPNSLNRPPSRFSPARKIGRCTPRRREPNSLNLGVPPLHTTPLLPRVCQLRPSRPRLPPRHHCPLQRALSEIPVAVEFPFLFLRRSGSLKHEILWPSRPRPPPFETPTRRQHRSLKYQR